MTVEVALAEAVRWAHSQSLPSCRQPWRFILPAYQPYATLLLRRLLAAWPSGLHVHVDGGIGLRGTAVGQRLHLLLRAVATGLQADAMVDLLPWLRRGLSDAPRGDALWEPRLLRSRAVALVYETGADDRPDGPRNWGPRFRARQMIVQRDIDRHRAAEKVDRAAQRTLVSERQQAERWLRDVTPILPALDRLDVLGAPAAVSPATLWQEIAEFASKWLLLPPEPPSAVVTIAAALAGLGEAAVLQERSCAADLLARVMEDVRCETHPVEAANVVIATAGSKLLAGEGATFEVPAAADVAMFQRSASKPAMRSWSLGGLGGACSSSAGLTSSSAAESASLERVRQLLRRARGSEGMHLPGDLGSLRASIALPGLTAQRPLSASALGILLNCPHQFLLQRLVHWNALPPSVRNDRVDPAAYGALFHAAADKLLRRAGAALCRRQGSLEGWREVGREVAQSAFATLLESYPLWGAGNIDRERRRLQAQLDGLVVDEWQRPPREPVGCEWRFGEPDAVGIGPADATLYVRGSIDRIDALASGGLSVRDLKTGFLRTLEEQPLHAGRDLQLGIYLLVLERIGIHGERRVDEAAYVQPGADSSVQRQFRGEGIDDLRRATHQWLRVAHGLLARGWLVRTPHPSDCRICPFVPVCGEGAASVSARVLGALPPEHELHAFRAFKGNSGQG